MLQKVPLGNAMDQFDKRFEQAFGKVSFVVNRFILEHMTRITRELDLDLESTYLWGVLANLNVMHLLSHGSSHGGPIEVDSALAHEFRGVRLSDLTQVTGIPRETVRRKLKALQARGKIERNSNGLWVIKMSGVDNATRAFTKETVVRCIRVAKELESLLTAVKL